MTFDSISNSKDKNGICYRNMKTVLIVDDEPSICMLVSEVLAECGVPVCVAQDGYEAVRKLKELSPEIGIAVLDYGLPGMDCETLIKEILRINEKIKLIISSGEPGLKFTDAEKQSIAAMIPKPYSMRDMSELVLALLKDSVK